MCQILGALPRVLALHLPKSFKELLRYLAVIFQFDITMFGIGELLHEIGGRLRNCPP